jgi:hypothetical protein
LEAQDLSVCMILRHYIRQSRLSGPGILARLRLNLLLKVLCRQQPIKTKHKEVGQEHDIMIRVGSYEHLNKYSGSINGEVFLG